MDCRGAIRIDSPPDYDAEAAQAMSYDLVPAEQRAMLVRIPARACAYSICSVSEKLVMVFLSDPPDPQQGRASV